MSEQNAVPLMVLSAARDAVEIINGVLRRSGYAAHCTWIPSLRDLSDALAQINPELMLVVNDNDTDLDAVATTRAQVAPAVSLILVFDTVDETRIAEAMRNGARDAVSFDNLERFQAVIARELRVARLERILSNTLRTANDARQQLETVLQRSNDAILQVQEGIVVEANAAWLELCGFADAQALIGQPVMDLFAQSSQAALKGALAACLQGKWDNHALAVSTNLSNETTLDIDVVLTLGKKDEEACVRLVVPSKARDSLNLEVELREAMQRDRSTHLLNRPALLQELKQRLNAPISGGVRYVGIIRPDGFATLEKDLGASSSESCLIEFATLLKEHAGSKDLVGRLGGVNFLILLERGNEHDIEAWCTQFVAACARHVVQVKEQSLAITCTIGISVVPPQNANLDAILADALNSCRRGRQRSGNQVVTSDHADTDTRVQSYDAVWIKHIKAALMENRFRLVQQPVASLQGENADMFDVLVRMLDHQGKEVLPAEFLPAAERNDLLKSIDRWVVGASLTFAAQRRPGCIFVRLSKDTLRDQSFLGWLDLQSKATQAEPARICFQITESIVNNHLTQAQNLSKGLRERGFRFALDNFGSGRDPFGLLETLALDFVKIDGALIQSLHTDNEIQTKVRSLIESTRQRQIQTIAERVESANTMAILWQLGVQYIQGYFVNAPEQVVLSASR
jgi:multidomain signaling protein FimX